MSKKEFKKLCNDTVCKLVFSHVDILKWFLERTLKKQFNKIDIFNGQDSKPITEESIIQLIQQELMKENVNVKSKIVDLLVKVENEIYNIEYNNVYDEDTRKRNFAYIANIYSNSLKKKDTYLNQPICTQINLCSKIENNYKEEVNYIKGENYNKKFINNINIYEFNIAEYKKILYTGNTKLIKENLHLIMFDCNDQELEMLEEYDEMVKKIRKLVNKYNDDSTIYQFLTTEEDQEKMNKTRILRAEQKGIEQGIEKNKLDTVYKMLEKKYPISDIESVTGYSKEYLQSIHI